MEHVAIDLGGRESQICARGSDAKILEERRVLTSRLGSYLKGRPKSRVVVETCAEAFAVADAAEKLGHEVRVVPATLVRSLGIGARGIKTDQRDARVLSEVSCRVNLPSVHVPSATSRERKTQCGMRDALVRSRTMLVNNVRGWLRTHVQRLAIGSLKTFPERVRRKSIELPDGIPSYVERQLQTIEHLTKGIVEADRELSELARRDDVCRRLMSVPGVGPVTSLRFTAAVDQVKRFDSAHPLESYLGLTPGENSSSDRQRRTSITKAGSPALRWTLVQACWSALRCRPKDPMVQWAREVEKRRGSRIAVIALARKMAGILYALWRDGTTYDPKRGAAAKEIAIEAAA